MSRALHPLLFSLLFLLTLTAQASSAKKEEGEAAATSQYIDIKPALVTNYGGPGPIHFIKAEIALRVSKEPEAQVQVAHHMPRIRHELVMLFTRQTEDNVTTMQGKEQLRADALAAVQKIFKDENSKPMVEDLLFNNFIIQR